ncbi:lipase/esteras-like protein [Lepidopterella palustris CBS 459.81]|uniref:Lipase/esteras-like protein n=1 Tax=Lepidopterella palustris CBS 459.81 TaxID=1314670 RepID=A0A8E2JGK3_9PEZI|nr:lipase/esteras-like protein [Lepidopterella palustris CBS 459.81]
MNLNIPGLIESFRAKLHARSFLPISTQQAIYAEDRPAKGPVWVSRVKFPVTHYKGLHPTVVNAVKALGDGDEQFHIPENLDIVGEWVGHRRGVGKDEPEPSICDQHKFDNLMKDTNSDVTLLYVHGGALYTGCAANVRPATSTLAKLTKGRCFSVNYRLSPQYPFPGALVDVFGAYLALLYPPPGSCHNPVSPSKLVLTGESSGANLILALLLLIQHLKSMPMDQKSGITVNGSEIDIPFPAGVALYSAEGDRTHALPSYESNAKLDLLQIPQPCLDDRFPPDAIWPSKPPRGDIYCEISALCHPLVSPITASPQSWSGMPPFWFSYGQEQLVDDGRVIAQRIFKNGGTVQFAEYEGLPHIFAFLFPQIPQSANLLVSWANFCTKCVENPRSINTRSVKYEISGKEFRGKDIQRLTELDEETVRGLMEKKKETYKVWTGKQDSKASL